MKANKLAMQVAKPQSDGLLEKLQATYKVLEDCMTSSAAIRSALFGEGEEESGPPITTVNVISVSIAIDKFAYELRDHLNRIALGLRSGK